MIRQVFDLKTDKRVEILDITHEINSIIKNSGIITGIVSVFSKHSTSGIFVNENESGLLKDFNEAMETLVPSNRDYNHNRIDNNADSHIRSFFIGNSETIPVDNGKLDLGMWQSIFFVELDGPRSREVTVTVMGE